MSAIVANALSYKYRRTLALDGLSLEVPEGATYALLGPNGSGKTTLMQALLGMRRPTAGTSSILQRDSASLRDIDRQSIGYIAEGQQLPRGMRIRDFERYLAPLYPSWDHALADRLRARFRLDATRRLGALSRGEYMKAAMLFALAWHPRVLLMDEPFTGMDVGIKDDLVRGLLDTSAAEGCTLLISSHDLGELETLCDWVGFLAHGRMHLSEPMERLGQRFRHVDVTLAIDHAALVPDANWLKVERAGRRLTFVIDDAGEAFDARALASRFSGATQFDVRPATLREVFLAMQLQTQGNAGFASARQEVAA